MDCRKCLDFGVVELRQGNFKTLGLCFCKAGRRQIWRLPRIPMQDYSDQPLDYREFKPKGATKNIFTGMTEEIAWWKQKVSVAEQFWANEWARERAENPDGPDAA